MKQCIEDRTLEEMREEEKEENYAREIGEKLQ